MIISHKNKVIYIRLQKVASTSFEAAFSKYCGPKDIITRLGKPHDQLREDLGYASEQNVGKKEKKKKRMFHQHIPANKIKGLIPADVWNNYLKIATIRNPYDWIISQYYGIHLHYEKNRDRFNHKGKLTFEEFVVGRINRIIRKLYAPIHIKGKSVIDFYIRYEHLTEDIKQLETKIDCPGLSETMQRFSFNSKFRPKKASLAEMYDKYPKAKLAIDELLQENLDKYDFLREHWHIHKF